MKRIWYVFDPVSDLSSSSSLDGSHKDIPARPRRPARSSIKVIVIDMSVATQLLDVFVVIRQTSYYTVTER